MSFGEYTVTIGNLMEKECYGDGILMGIESSGRRSNQSRLLTTWRSIGMLTYIGKTSNSGMAKRLKITTDINDVPEGTTLPEGRFYPTSIIIIIIIIVEDFSQGTVWKLYSFSF